MSSANGRLCSLYEKHPQAKTALEVWHLTPYIGNKSKVSEVLNRKIGLSLNMIYNLSKGLDLPLEVLVRPSR